MNFDSFLFFPRSTTPIQRKGGKQQLLLFSSATEVKALIEALQLTTNSQRKTDERWFRWINGQTHHWMGDG